ncbi:hypothetical protein HED60_07120 [Planctomycetales bacterium ZRK34]|nr:hypothetical protein HED60_07120 [Planctomycetales bacterium ZRK34]
MMASDRLINLTKHLFEVIGLLILVAYALSYNRLADTTQTVLGVIATTGIAGYLIWLFFHLSLDNKPKLPHRVDRDETERDAANTSLRTLQREHNKRSD